MQILWELKLKEKKCGLYLTSHGNDAMVDDDLEDDVVLETIIDGKKNKNHRGPGYIYKKGVIEAIAYWIPCHCIVITAYNKNKSDKPHKDKKTHGSARKNGLPKVRQS